MDKMRKIENLVDETIDLFENLEEIQPSDNFNNSLKNKLLKESEENEKQFFSVLKLSLSSAFMILFLFLNVYVLWNSFTNKDNSKIRSQYVAALASDYHISSDSNNLFFEN